MPLPKQVQKTLEDVEAVERSLKGEDTPEPETPPEQPDTEATAAPAPVETPETDTTSEEKWEHKYRRLQGKYDAEVPRLHNQVKELSIQLHQMRQEMSAQEQQAAQRQQEQAQRLVTDEEIEEHGQEYVDLYRRIAREEFQKDLASLKQENEQLKQYIQQTGSQIGSLSFEQKLAQLVPDFGAINNDPKWVEWLDTYDPMLRSKRRDVAQAAMNSGDAEAVAHYVKLFRGESAPEQTKSASRQAEINRQVQPDRASAPTVQSSKTGKTYSQSDLGKMFRRVAVLGSQGKHDEARKLEMEIDSAFQDGRVTA